MSEDRIDKEEFRIDEDEIADSIASLASALGMDPDSEELKELTGLLKAVKDLDESCGGCADNTVSMHAEHVASRFGTKRTGGWFFTEEALRWAVAAIYDDSISAFVGAIRDNGSLSLSLKDYKEICSMRDAIVRGVRRGLPE